MFSCSGINQIQKLHLKNHEKFYSLLFLAILGSNAQANVFRVNNTKDTEPSQKIFKSLQEAHDYADTKAGDTLMIEGSSLLYEDVVLNKRLILIGPGYFLAQNPQTQSNVLEVKLKHVKINPLAAGTVLEGLTFATGNSNWTPGINADNTIIRRSYLPTAIWFQSYCSGTQIIGCYFVRQVSISSVTAR